MTHDEEKFLDSFENCLLPPGEWTHAAHIQMAWLCLQADVFDAALTRIRAGILRYNAKVLNKLGEYHETVTVAFATLIASRIEPGETWEQFRGRNADLFARKPPALANYYSAEMLMSERARSQFVEPDLQPLPRKLSGNLVTKKCRGD
ncbi:MAG: hypothetical protein HKN59_02050 [Gammaproteobacteria bacterium]|nr:hypothetical protein [Gammaproteobacteria bacterium]